MSVLLRFQSLSSRIKECRYIFSCCKLCIKPRKVDTFEVVSVFTRVLARITRENKDRLPRSTLRFWDWADPKQLEIQRKCTYINGFNDSLSGYLVIHSDLRWMVQNAKHQPQYSSSSVPQWSSGPRSTLCPYRPTFFLIPYSPKLIVVKGTAKESI